MSFVSRQDLISWVYCFDTRQKNAKAKNRDTKNLAGDKLNEKYLIFLEFC